MKKLFLMAASVAMISGVAFVSHAEDMGKHIMDGKKMMNHGKHKGGMLAGMDGNDDGIITKDEFIAHATHRFTEADANSDGQLTEEEMDNLNSEYGILDQDLNEKRMILRFRDANGQIREIEIDYYEQNQQ